MINLTKLLTFALALVLFAYALHIQGASAAVVGCFLIVFIGIYAFALRSMNSKRTQRLKSTLERIGDTVEPDTALALDPCERAFAFVDGKAINLRVAISNNHIYLYKWHSFAVRLSISRANEHESVTLDHGNFWVLGDSNGNILLPIPKLLASQEPDSIV